MNSEQCERLRDRLMQYLENSQLSWIRDQIDARLAEGRPVEKGIMIDFYDEETGSPSRRKKRVKYMGTERLPPADELRIVLDAISSAVISTCEMELQILKNIKPGSPPDAVTFVAEDDETPEVQIDARSTSLKADGLEQLKNALSNCRRELANNGS